MKALLLLAGLAVFVGGGAVTFAYMMSDDPIGAQGPSNRSCLASVAGLIAAIAAIVWMFV